MPPGEAAAGAGAEAVAPGEAAGAGADEAVAAGEAVGAGAKAAGARTAAGASVCCAARWIRGDKTPEGGGGGGGGGATTGATEDWQNPAAAQWMPVLLAVVVAVKQPQVENWQCPEPEAAAVATPETLLREVLECAEVALDCLRSGWGRTLARGVQRRWCGVLGQELAARGPPEVLMSVVRNHREEVPPEVIGAGAGT